MAAPFRPGVAAASLGGKPDEGKGYFDKALELSGGKNQMVRVLYAQFYARLVFDQALHDRLLNEVLVADPVGSGYVASLPRPGGNVTGFTPIAGSLGGKWVQLLKEIAPSVAKVSLVFNPPTATFIEGYLSPFKTAAASLGMEALVAPVQDMPEVELVVATQTREPNNGLVVIPDSFTVGHRAEITALAARYRVPAIYWSRSLPKLAA